MNNTEEQHPVFIPRNFIEKGTFMGGMFKIRNAIEGGVLAILDVYKRQLYYTAVKFSECD